MAKDSLIGGSIWEAYSQKVQDLMNNPQNMGQLTEEDAKAMGGKLIIADFGAESCGDAVRLYWIVDEATEIIKAAKFKSFGCGTAIASSDTMAELCIGKTVSQAVKITNFEDEIIVFECARVTLGTIKEVIKINDLKTVEEITNYTKAGAFCKSCIKPGGHEAREYYLVDILRDTRAEMEHTKMAALADSKVNGVHTISFEEMTVVQKLKEIEAIIDENIRPMLIMDGGNLEILDIKSSVDGMTDVYIRYLGACSGCASSSTGTLYAIEAVLQEKLSKNIRILPI